MSKIRIVSWLLTRRCNLKCSYCGIVRDSAQKPEEYPPVSHYIKNEMGLDTVIETLARLKKHNPDCFHIFYGGEPLLRDDLPDIINFCNVNNIHYTVITNNSEAVQKNLKRLFKKTNGKVMGLTSSVDPIFKKGTSKDDRIKKTFAGFEKLKEYKKFVNDVVAEITVSKDNIENLLPLLRSLTKEGICGDITFVDIAKNSYYDFSNVKDPLQLVYPSQYLAGIFSQIGMEDLNIHMKDTLLNEIWKTLPSEVDCKIEDGLHNLTIDADGSVRLCLRIRGIAAPTHHILDSLNFDGTFSDHVYKNMLLDKKNCCLGCNWTCILMSQIIDRNESLNKDLVHNNIRRK